MMGLGVLCASTVPLEYSPTDVGGIERHPANVPTKITAMTEAIFNIQDSSHADNPILIGCIGRNPA